MPYVECQYCHDTGCLHCRRDLAYRMRVQATQNGVEKFLQHASEVGLIDPANRSALMNEAGPLLAEAIEYGRQDERERLTRLRGPHTPETRTRLDMLELHETRVQ